MSLPASPAIVRFFLRVLALKRAIVGTFLVLTLAALVGVLRVPEDASIESLMVPDNADARATREFERLFPEGQHALLLLESPQPLSLVALRAADELQGRLGAIHGVEAQSLLTIACRDGCRPLDASQAARIAGFARGTALLRRAGLLGDHFLGMSLELHVRGPEERDRALAAIEAAAAQFQAPRGPFSAVRRIGGPWLDAWLERQTATATARFMPLFGLFLMALVLGLYRSWRTLGAIVLTLAAVVAMAVGLAAVFGWAHTVVSALVPLTVLITTTATLVYLHSRYVERDDAVTPLQHHAEALANKLLPCTASMFATAVGFAALAVSDIRPIRDMGLWTAAGLAVAWVGSFTLFPALQALLRTPTRGERAPAVRWFPRFAEGLVPFSRRYRWPLVAAALVTMVFGAAALFGVPGHLAPLALQTDALAYVNPREPIARDTRRYEEMSGLGIFELWLQVPSGRALDPEFLRGVEQLTQRLEADPRITAVDGPTAALRWARYVQSGDDRLPSDPSAWSKLAEDLDQILLSEPGARGYVDVASLANVRLEIRGRDLAFGGPGTMRRYIEQTLRATQLAVPALQQARGRVVGQSVLSEQIALQLVPTLKESFALTASVIFCAFLVVFRSPAARLMAMIPSVFAILASFLVMRATGIGLNVATILIGSTVLGATENDQVHFFYHYQEGSSNGSTAGALRHALLAAGRPIVFATLINAAGFLALAFSDLPPMREFGIVSASAFLLALLADFTALPGALWILQRSPRTEVR